MTKKDGEQPLRRDAARNRERLLAAAARVFSERGLRGGVDEVARDAGLGIATLYRHFPSKDTLIEELVDELLVDILEDAQDALRASDGHGLEKFLDAVGSRLGLLPRLWTTAWRAKLRTEIRVTIAALLADAQRHGQVRADLVPEDVFVLIWSMRGVIETTTPIAPDVWRRHLEIHLIGMRPPELPLVHKPSSEAVLDRVFANLSV